MTDETIAVIGAGQAGAWAARTLRDEGFAGRVFLVGDELSPPYERPPLSKEHLQPQAPALPFLLDEAAMADKAIEWRPGTTCLSIERDAARIQLSDDTSIAYDKLILCTGGRARVPAIPGVDGPCVHTLRTIDDAKRLRVALKEDLQVLVVGGGWIGMEVAASARRLGAHVTLVEAADRLCARTDSAPLSSWLTRLHRANGIDLRLGVGVSAFEDARATGCTAVLTSGSRLEAHVVVVGVGLVPNDALAHEAGLVCNRGVVVDRQCRTSDASIFAAGDVTAMRGQGEGLLRLESWQNAQDQAIAAARAALGKDVDYRPLPFFWSHQYESTIQLVGVASPGARLASRGEDTDKMIAVQLAADGRVLNAACTNSPRDFRLLRKFVSDGTRLSAERLADASIPLASTAL